MRKHVADIKYVCNPQVFTFLLYFTRLNPYPANVEDRVSS